ncbi:hypothetical protein FM042_09680 [Aliidiomarina halalkaliphila]|uniref:Uncharacterized protein n=1 Tax=Aliidiomarina halalkaliphila TaxID=2593535 RepID=A0A552X038_9GAMM|nr:hypothetical protein [Aliidiomarina halalkaliphila]TRW48431.1 hypothetical protein FM042_09680 [Aliidiomarina halalkaliphila]
MNTLTTRCFLVLVCLPFFLVGCQQTAVQQETYAPATTQQPTMEDYCAEHACRGETHIELATIDGGYQHKSSYYWPVVKDNSEIRVLAGERVFIEVLFDEFGSPKEFIHVNEIQHPTRTFEFNFRQVAGNYGMLATLRNPLNQPVIFSVTLVDVDGKTRTAGTCPIRPNRSFMDQWAFPATELVLSNLQVLHPSSPIVCTGS